MKEETNGWCEDDFAVQGCTDQASATVVGGRVEPGRPARLASAMTCAIPGARCTHQSSPSIQIK
jgi:hypothetical protein